MFAYCTMHIFKYEIFSLMVFLEEDLDQGGSPQHSLEMGFFCSITGKEFQRHMYEDFKRQWQYLLE